MQQHDVDWAQQLPQLTKADAVRLQAFVQQRIERSGAERAVAIGAAVNIVAEFRQVRG